MDPSAEHHQDLTGSDDQSLESILAGPTKPLLKKPKPNDEEALKCPRCKSTNTKFCYYNNYSLSQPRYFCKSCRRYWTKGGTLRNVPVGGGCRKSKRSTSSKRIMVSSFHQEHPQDHPHSHSHSLDDLIALNLSGNPFAGLHDIAYDAPNLYSPLTFAHQLHKLTGGQFDGHGLTMGLGIDQEYLEAPSTGNIPGPYYGLGDGAIGVEFTNNGSGISGDCKLPFEDLKQDFCSVDNRVLWGCPWPVNGEGISNMDDISSMRHGFGFGSTWPSLLNSPLM